MGETIDHFKELYILYNTEGIGSAIKHDIRTTRADLDSLLEEEMLNIIAPICMAIVIPIAFYKIAQYEYNKYKQQRLLD